MQENVILARWPSPRCPLYKGNIGFSSLQQMNVVTAKAVISTKTPQVGNGIDFVDMDAEDRLKLREYIAECERQAEAWAAVAL